MPVRGPLRESEGLLWSCVVRGTTTLIARGPPLGLPMQGPQQFYPLGPQWSLLWVTHSGLSHRSTHTAPLWVSPWGARSSFPLWGPTNTHKQAHPPWCKPLLQNHVKIWEENRRQSSIESWTYREQTGKMTEQSCAWPLYYIVLELHVLWFGTQIICYPKNKLWFHLHPPQLLIKQVQLDRVECTWEVKKHYSYSCIRGVKMCRSM